MKSQTHVALSGDQATLIGLAGNFLNGSKICPVGTSSTVRLFINLIVLAKGFKQTLHLAQTRVIHAIVFIISCTIFWIYHIVITSQIFDIFQWQFQLSLQPQFPLGTIFRHTTRFPKPPMIVCLLATHLFESTSKRSSILIFNSDSGLGRPRYVGSVSI